MQLYQTIHSETETWQISVLCYLRCSSLCNTEVFRALGKGRAERKVNAAVGSVQKQQAEARSNPWKRGSRREGSRNLWKL